MSIPTPTMVFAVEVVKDHWHDAVCIVATRPGHQLCGTAQTVAAAVAPESATTPMPVSCVTKLMNTEVANAIAWLLFLYFRCRNSQW